MRVMLLKQLSIEWGKMGYEWTIGESNGTVRTARSAKIEKQVENGKSRADHPGEQTPKSTSPVAELAANDRKNIIRSRRFATLEVIARLNSAYNAYYFFRYFTLSDFACKRVGAKGNAEGLLRPPRK
jgi:hypothetical protein